MSEIDWSKAPEGATHYAPKREENCMWRAVFWRIEDGRGVEAWSVNNDGSLQYYENPTWIASDIRRLIERPSFASWTGTGLPPVGTVCEGYAQGFGPAYAWHKCKVLHANKEECAVMLDNSMLRWCDQFRPIRTQAQIEAEERKHAIDAMSAATQGAHNWIEAFGKLHDAGYRKQGEDK